MPPSRKFRIKIASQIHFSNAFLISAFCFLLNLLCCASAQAAETLSNQDDLQSRLLKLDMIIQQDLTAQGIPAYCLAVIKDGKTVFQKAYGNANLDLNQPASPDTVFGLASLTKTFTALALLDLVDKGKVGLEDPLAKYIPGLTKQYQSLTIRQLASMSAGVPSKVEPEVAWVNQLDILEQSPLLSNPGSQFLYSNYSYRLLGSVIEKASSMPYLQYVENTILAPLAMTSTGTTVMFRGSGRLAQAYGDAQGKGPLRAIEYKNPAISFSAGMLASTSNDLLKYVSALLQKRLVSSKAYSTLWYERPALSTGEPCPWAFGWHSGQNQSIGGKLVLAMNGGTPGVASSIIILPETNSAIVALSNLRKPPVYQIAKKALVIVFAEQADSGNPAVTSTEYQSAGSESDN